MKIKISITDDHPLVLSGLKTLLRTFKHIEVVATYADGEELLKGLERIQPDVLLTDLQMPGKIHGLELIKLIRERYPQLPVLVLSGQETIFNIKDVMAMGCKGYLLKNTTDPDMLTAAIVEVYYGGLFLEPSIKNNLLRGLLKVNEEKEQVSKTITQRQIEIINLLSAGCTSQEIAEKLYLSVRTVESHRHRIMKKLDVSNVTSMLQRCRELGLVGPSTLPT